MKFRLWSMGVSGAIVLCGLLLTAGADMNLWGGWDGRVLGLLLVLLGIIVFLISSLFSFALVIGRCLSQR